MANEEADSSNSKEAMTESGPMAPQSDDQSVSNKPGEQKTKMLQDLLQTFTNAYLEASGNFSYLDTKAQNMTSVAGVFLAGALAFFNGESLQKYVQIGGGVAVVLLGIAVLLLMASTAFCIQAMRIREISILDVSLSREEIDEILTLPHSDWTERYQDYLGAQIDDWMRTIEDLHSINTEKAGAVSRGQLFLGFAILVVAGLLLLILGRTWL